MNLDRYLPPTVAADEGAATQQSTPSTSTTASAAPVEIALPMDTLRELNLDGRLKAGKLIASDLSVTDMKVDISAHQGLIELKPLSANLYEGKVTGDMWLDARADLPKFGVNTRLADVQINPLLKDFLDNDQLQGKANLNVDVKTAGGTDKAIIAALSGKIGFSVVDGALKGVNIPYELRSAYAKYKQRPLPSGDVPKQTDFTELKGTANINKGVVRNQDLKITSELLSVKGRGTANLNNEILDYTADVTVIRSLNTPTETGYDEIKGLMVPVRVTGTFAEPKIRPDISAVLKAKAKQQIKRKKEELKQEQEEKIEEKKEELKQELEDKVKDKLKGLFRR
jgi:AsmA protein